MNRGELTQMQQLPLHHKIIKTCARIQEWYDFHDGMIYVAFSGGVDSLVVGDITRRMYPDIPLVFSNTGQEDRKLVSFVKSIPGVTIIRPEHSYKWVYTKYGYPVISKEVSKNISRVRGTTSEFQKELRMYGGINPTSGKKQNPGIPAKWHFLINAPFKISDVCCDILKKTPFLKYERETGRHPMTGVMAEDSNKRRIDYLRRGCNFYGKHPVSTPVGFWTEQDILSYLLVFRVRYCSEVYGDIIYNPTDGKLSTTKEHHTGCKGCMYGVQLEPADNNRFIRMKTDDPRMWEIYIRKYGQDKILDFIGVKYE